jgi:DNA-binding GntR family transcriptional regulator
MPSDGGGAAAGLKAASEPGAQLAYEQIRRRIVEGALAPGARLVEQRLAEDLALSRTPVREAVRLLQSEGLVVVRPNRGASVRQLAADEVADLYDLRARLEAMAAELAAERADDGDRAAIESAESDFAAAVADEAAAGGSGPTGRTSRRSRRPGGLASTRRLFAANERFHGAIVAAARHPRLAHTLGRSVDAGLVFQAFRHYDAEELARSVLFHRLIAEAVTRGEGARAGRLALEHVLRGRDRLVAALAAPPERGAAVGD